MLGRKIMLKLSNHCKEYLKNSAFWIEMMRELIVQLLDFQNKLKKTPQFLDEVTARYLPDKFDKPNQT